MPPVGFEPAIPVSERPQTHALDRAATAIDTLHLVLLNYLLNKVLPEEGLCVMYRVGKDLPTQ